MSRQPWGAQAGFDVFYVVAVEEELVDAFLMAPDEAGTFSVTQAPRPETGPESLQKSPGATSFRVAVAEFSVGAESHEFASAFSLLDSDRTNPCWREGHIVHTRTLGLVHELLVLARQAQQNWLRLHPPQ